MTTNQGTSSETALPPLKDSIEIAVGLFANGEKPMDDGGRHTYAQSTNYPFMSGVITRLMSKSRKVASSIHIHDLPWMAMLRSGLRLFRRRVVSSLRCVDAGAFWNSVEFNGFEYVEKDEFLMEMDAMISPSQTMCTNFADHSRYL